MTQPTRTRRREIWQALWLSYGVISDILWRERLTTGQAVGTCSECHQLLKPMEPEQAGPRPVYPARCVGCGREVQGVGPRLSKAKKGGA